MTELEERILNCAKECISLNKDRIAIIAKDCISDYIEIPFVCDGVFDTLVYSVKEQRFVKVKYMYGIGPGTIGYSTNYTGYFDDFEIREIDIPIEL